MSRIIISSLSPSIICVATQIYTGFSLSEKLSHYCFCELILLKIGYKFADVASLLKDPGVYEIMSKLSENNRKVNSFQSKIAKYSPKSRLSSQKKTTETKETYFDDKTVEKSKIKQFSISGVPKVSDDKISIKDEILADGGIPLRTITSKIIPCPRNDYRNIDAVKAMQQKATNEINKPKTLIAPGSIAQPAKEGYVILKYSSKLQQPTFGL